jgi:hypothetical protein
MCVSCVYYLDERMGSSLNNCRRTKEVRFTESEFVFCYTKDPAALQLKDYYGLSIYDNRRLDALKSSLAISC